MGRPGKQSEQRKQHERMRKTAVYIAPAIYGEEVSMEESLQKCREYIGKDSSLRLMRIYRDGEVKVRGGNTDLPDEETRKKVRKRNPLTTEGNDAWNRLLTDLGTGAVDTVVVYAARVVAPSFNSLDYYVRQFFIPCGIRFVDVEYGFDTARAADDEIRAYFSDGIFAYRSQIKRSEYRKSDKHERLRLSPNKYKGVSWKPGYKGKYSVNIGVNNKTIHIGVFESRVEAAKAYDEAARRYFGKEAFLNFPKDGERSCRTGEIVTETEEEPWEDETKLQNPHSGT